jgi:Zn-dependent protease
MGIPIALDYTWFVIFALMTWSLATSYYPAEFKNWQPPVYWITGAMTAIMLFTSVLLHELGHSAIALRYKIPVRSITLFIFGGVAQIGREPPSATAEFFVAVAGPIVSLVLALLFALAKPMVAGVEPLWAVAKYLAYINAAIVLFNLVPGYPLDGGRVFRAIVWAATKDLRRSTLIAANVGRLFGFIFVLVGVWHLLSGDFGGLWIAFIGWFLDGAANAQIQQVILEGLLAGHTVSQAMSRKCISVPADVTVQEIVDDHILRAGQRCLLVYRGEQAIGLLTIHEIKQLPKNVWATQAASTIMIPFEKLKRTAPEEDLWTALQQMDRDGVNQLPVMIDNRVVGMLTREDVITFLRTLLELRS